MGNGESAFGAALIAVSLATDAGDAGGTRFEF
jgi:hypothetical protein